MKNPQKKDKRIVDKIMFNIAMAFTYFAILASSGLAAVSSTGTPGPLRMLFDLVVNGAGLKVLIIFAMFFAIGAMITKTLELGTPGYVIFSIIGGIASLFIGLNPGLFAKTVTFCIVVTLIAGVLHFVPMDKIKKLFDVIFGMIKGLVKWIFELIGELFKVGWKAILIIGIVIIVLVWLIHATGIKIPGLDLSKINLGGQTYCGQSATDAATGAGVTSSAIKSLDSASLDQLKKVCNYYFARASAIKTPECILLGKDACNKCKAKNNGNEC